ncbi:MAG TPA: arginine N-succinyltransferase, partial [Marinobacter sp.]|nr:arginine N-succinyltransferase [Marinobacter sp.]
EARTDSLRTIATSHRKTLHGTHEVSGDLCLVAAGEGAGFRCTLTGIAESVEGQLKVPVKAWKVLGKSAGDSVRAASL